MPNKARIAVVMVFLFLLPVITGCFCYSNPPPTCGGITERHAYIFFGARSLSSCAFAEDSQRACAIAREKLDDYIADHDLSAPKKFEEKTTLYDGQVQCMMEAKW